MDQMAAAAYAAEMERLLLEFSVEIDELEYEVAESANVRWESQAADAFRHGLAGTVRPLPGVAHQLRAAAGELRQDPLALAAGS